MPGGAPTKYKPEYCDRIKEYFSVEPFTVMYKKEYFMNGELKSETPILTANELPTFEGFADSIDVDDDTVVEWTKVHNEFSAAYTRAKKKQERIWKVNGLQGLYNSQFAQFIGKNCLGYKDKVEHDINVTGVTIIDDLTE